MVRSRQSRPFRVFQGAMAYHNERKGVGEGAEAHRGSWWPELLCKVDAGVVERRRWAELRGSGDVGLLRAPGWHDSQAGGAVKRAERITESGVQRQREIPQNRSHLRRRGPGENSGAAERV